MSKNIPLKYNKNDNEYPTRNKYFFSIKNIFLKKLTVQKTHNIILHPLTFSICSVSKNK